MNINFKIDDTHKSKILFKIMIVFLTIFISCYVIKVIFGLEIFKFITNTQIDKISQYVATRLWADLLFYTILNYMMFYFIAFAICTRFCLKSNKNKYLTILYNFILLLICFIISLLRYFYYSVAFGLILDLLQYIIIPVIMSKFIFKNDFSKSLLKAFEIYLMILGIQNISLMLNNMILGDIYQNGFIIDFIFNFETYVFVILYYLKENYRRLSSGCNTKNYKQEIN